MRDVSLKPNSLRSATAEGRVRLSAAGLALIRERRVDKGDVQECARIAGLMAVKKTPDWLPHCHPLPILDAGLDFTLEETALRITARVRTIAATGVEMEALTAVSAAALTVYDMMKPHVPAAELGIDGIHLLEKQGGKSDFSRDAGGASAAVIVLSDTVAAGRKPDTAGKSVAEGLQAAGFTLAAYEVLPDEPAQLEARVRHWLDQGLALIVSVGGTGVGPRDKTVETLRPLLVTELPGLMEAARNFGQQRTPYAMLSRGIAGLAGSNTVLMTFPGSRKGAEESLAAVLPGLVHLIRACRWGQPHAGGYR
ncbi:MAG: bifunctional molybdenum cofactor biosynthesis protein MoaC/MoaB [Nevskiaceae bacterium]|nr:MAG: bifunctional molybdenum cofactor biosynthesis protein MoaC/MoaB [Nevskiaceae bacterium]TAM21075.1 MAG: bifunctional molybdenum cofactor biosynthesis protein MoaC/MoaB [Nevskiaceae bacterium]